MVNTIMGAGVVTLPFAYKLNGFTLATVMVVAVALLSVFTIRMVSLPALCRL